MNRLVEMVRAGERKGRLPNATDFCREFGVSRQTVQADLDRLRDDEHAPIAYQPRRHGYRLTDPLWEMPAFRISRRELFAFAIAAKTLDAFRGTPLEVDLRSVMARIQESMEGKVTVDPAVLSDRVSVLSEDYVKLDAAIWEQSAKALSLQQRIRVRYRRFDGTVRVRTLEPYHLLHYHGNWYLFAGRVPGPGIGTFALSRILSLRRLKESFTIPTDFDPTTRLRDAFGIASGEEPMQVKVCCAPKITTYIGERVWHPRQKVKRCAGGELELSFVTTGWKEVVRWVLSWQPDMKVLAPLRLRERVEEKMREALGEEDTGGVKEGKRRGRKVG
jgi:proteasome accessory factor B